MLFLGWWYWYEALPHVSWLSWNRISHDLLDPQPREPSVLLYLVSLSFVDQGYRRHLLRPLLLMAQLCVYIS